MVTVHLLQKAQDNGGKLTFDDLERIMQTLGIEIISDDAAAEPVAEIDLNIPDGISIDDPVRMYLKEIGRVPLLTAEQERELAMRMESQDEAERTEAQKQLGFD